MIACERSQLVFRRIERDLRKLSSDQEAEVVHSFRTTTRRLETLLQQLLPDCDRNQKKLLKMLGRIRRRAGKIRDIDVQLAALRSLKVPQEPRRKTRLIQRLIAIRAQHEEKLSKLLKRESTRELKKRLKRAAKTVPLELGRDPIEVAKKILAAVPLPDKDPENEVLHQYRIAVKRARYAAEFAPKSPESTKFLADLKRLQDALGRWHDWLTVTQTATEHIGEVSQSSLVAALHNVTRGKFRQAVAALNASGGRIVFGRRPAVDGGSRKAAEQSQISVASVATTAA